MRHRKCGNARQPYPGVSVQYGVVEPRCVNNDASQVVISVTPDGKDVGEVHFLCGECAALMVLDYERRGVKFQRSPIFD